MTTATKRFVKSATTSTPVSASQREIEQILRRYGASDFAFGSNWEARIARISFRVPDTPGSAVLVPIRLEVSMQAVAEAIYGDAIRKPKKIWMAGKGYVDRPLTDLYTQAERVAWRHLVLWVDAACAAASAGLQTMSEAFLAHMLVKAPDGQIKKVSAMLDDAAGEGGYRALLPPGAP